jgi:hypothetical protein
MPILFSHMVVVFICVLVFVIGIAVGRKDSQIKSTLGTSNHYKSSGNINIKNANSELVQSDKCKNIEAQANEITQVG